MAKFKGSKFKQGDIQQDKKPQKCFACSGSGRYDSQGSPVCGACNGTGFEVDYSLINQTEKEIETLHSRKLEQS